MFRSKLSKPTMAVSAVGIAFATGLARIPETWRNHLPHMFDVASTASNLVPCIAIGAVLAELGSDLPRRNRFAVAAAALALSTTLNLAVENEQVNRILVPPEAQVAFGAGINGETRDLVHGIAGTALGVGFVSLGGRKKSKVTAN